MSRELLVAVLPLSSLTRHYVCNSQYAMTSFSKEKKEQTQKYYPCRGKDTYCIEADARFCNACESLEQVSEAVNSTDSSDLTYMTRL